MNGVEACDEAAIEGENIGLDELKRVAWLWRYIDAHHVKTSLMIAHSSAAATTEQVQQSHASCLHN